MAAAPPAFDLAAWLPQPKVFKCTHCDAVHTSKGASTRHLNGHIHARSYVQNFLQQWQPHSNEQREAAMTVARKRARDFVKLALLSRITRIGRTVLSRFTYEANFEELYFVLSFGNCPLAVASGRNRLHGEVKWQGHTAKAALTPILGDDWYTAELANDNAEHRMAYIAFETSESGRLLDVSFTFAKTAESVFMQTDAGARSVETVINSKLKIAFWRGSTIRI